MDGKWLLPLTVVVGCGGLVTAGAMAAKPASYFPVPAHIAKPPQLPPPQAMPHIIVMDDMWWSLPSSRAFILGCDPRQPDSGFYENAPLIPVARHAVNGRKLDALDGRLVQMFRDAKAAGIGAIDFDFFTDAAGPGVLTSRGTFKGFMHMARVARLSGTGVKIAPMLDIIAHNGTRWGKGRDFLRRYWLYRDPKTGQLLREQPNIWRVGACPVVFEYQTASRKTWASRMERAEAVGGRFFIITHAAQGDRAALFGKIKPGVRHHIAFAPATYLFESNAEALGNPNPLGPLINLCQSFSPPKAVGGEVTPGYIGITRSGEIISPRGTWLYRRQWCTQIKLDPTFVTLGTGNDYSEDTDQECSADSTFTYLDLTHYFGTRWRTGKWPLLRKPEAFLSYHLAVAVNEPTEFQLVLLRPDITGREPPEQIARRFTAACRVRTSDGQMVDLPAGKPTAEMGQVVWRFWAQRGFAHYGYGVPQVRIRVDGKAVKFPSGALAPFSIMNPGEELARTWLSVPLARIDAGVKAKVVVTGSPGTLYPRTVRVTGLPWNQVAGGVLARNGITTLWYTLSGKVLRNGFVERFYSGPGYMPMRYRNGWIKRRVVDQWDRYTAVVRMRNGRLVYPQPAILPAPHVDPTTVMDLMIPPPLNKLGPHLPKWLAQNWTAGENVLVDRGPLGHDLTLPPAGSPARPVILRDGPYGPWYLRFDGKANRLLTSTGGGQGLDMPPGPVTVELWLRFRQTDHPQVIFDQQDPALAMALGPGGTLVAARLNRKMRLDVVKGPRALKPARWYDVTGVYDGRDLRLYVDGQPDGVPTASLGRRTDEGAVIGGSSNGPWLFVSEFPNLINLGLKRSFAGDLARIRVLQRAMSRAEVAVEYRAYARSFPR